MRHVPVSIWYCLSYYRCIGRTGSPGPGARAAGCHDHPVDRRPPYQPPARGSSWCKAKPCYDLPELYHPHTVFGPFTATTGRDMLTFEEFLAKARAEGLSDPGSAMLAVLRRYRVSGIDVSRIENDLSLNPSGNPGNILAFLCHIAEKGGWGVNMEVVVN